MLQEFIDKVSFNAEHALQRFADALGEAHDDVAFEARNANVASNFHGGAPQDEVHSEPGDGEAVQDAVVATSAPHEASSKSEHVPVYPQSPATPFDPLVPGAANRVTREFPPYV